MDQLVREYSQKSYERKWHDVHVIHETLPRPEVIQTPSMALPPLRPNDRDLPGGVHGADGPSQPQLSTEADTAIGDAASIHDAPQPYQSPGPAADNTGIEDPSQPQVETNPDTAMADVAGGHDAPQPDKSPSPPADNTRVEDTAQPQLETNPDTAMGDVAGSPDARLRRSPSPPADPAPRSVPHSPRLPTTIPSPAASQHIAPTALAFSDPPTSQFEETFPTSGTWATDRSILDAEFD